MPRGRNPLREKAFAMWTASSGSMPLKDIAAELGVSPSQVRNWKAQDGWDNVAQQNANHCATKRGPGAPKGSRNALGNRGGHGGPVENANAVTHGFFRRILPDDEETRAIMSEIQGMSPLDIIWHNIVLQFTNIARAQRIMFVQDKQDQTKVLKRVKESEIASETEWEYQHAWDKQANFMQAQSRAVMALEKLIEQYEAMLPKGLKTEEQRLRLEKLRAEIDHVKNPEGDDVEDWIAQIEAVAERRKKIRERQPGAYDSDS